MRRLLAFLVLTALVVGGAVWLADRPGEVTIRWQGWRLDTTVPVLLIVLAAVLAMLALIGRLVRLVLGAPRRWLASRRAKRLRKGYTALSDGLAAVASGDSRRAERLARKADKLLKDKGATALLAAQAAQMTAEGDQLRPSFEAMTERSETAFLGHKGLMDLALQRGDKDEARREGAVALALQPGFAGLAPALADLQAEAGEWAEAEQTLRTARRHGALGAAEVSRRMALLMFGRARAALDSGNEAQALDWAVEARDRDPLFVPAVALAASLYHRRGKTRKAVSLLKAAFAVTPHPALITQWLALGEGEAPLERVKRVQALVSRNPASPDGHVALAEAALAAQLWGQARTHLQKALEQRPERRVFALLARLEREERQDETAATAWMVKGGTDGFPDRAWTCGGCGRVTDEFSLACPSCGVVGRSEWI
ncbi:MAG: hypothetical protein HY055_07020 [Magnetospirillum sp.]|nr:hypothetical protein [Magnetospirillum sp.]